MREARRKRIIQRALSLILSLLLVLNLQPVSLQQVYAVNEGQQDTQDEGQQGTQNEGQQGEGLQEGKAIENIVVTPLNAVYQKGQPQDLVAGISGTQDGDNISYSTDGIHWQEDAIKEEAAGEYPIYVKISRAGYEDYVSGELTAIIAKADIEIEVTAYEKEYDDGGHPAVTVTGLQVQDVVTCVFAGEHISFTYSDEDSLQFPMIKNVGEYRIVVKVERDSANYHVYEQEVTAKIAAVAVEGITASYSGNLVYNGSAQDLVESIEGTQPGDVVSFSLDEGDTWNPWDTGSTGDAGSGQKPQGTDAGTYTVLLKVKRGEQEILLNPATIIIAKADQSISFTQNHTEEIIYLDSEDEENNRYDFSAEVQNGSGEAIEGAVVFYEVAYDFAEESAEDPIIGEVAEFVQDGGQDGLLAVKKAGYHIKVTARVEGDSNYNEAEVSHRLTILNNESDLIYFAETEVECVIGTGEAGFGESEIISTQNAIKKYGDDNGMIQYSAALSSSGGTQGSETLPDSGSVPDADALSAVGIAVDTDNGAVAISDLTKAMNAMIAADGKLTIYVTASKAEGTKQRGDGQEKAVYSECEASYTIILSAKQYTLKDPDGKELTGPNGNNGWYKTAVTVVPPSGYQISKDSASGVFEDEVVFDEESNIAGQEPGKVPRSVYLKDSNGNVAGPAAIDIKIDSSAPDQLGITIVPQEANSDSGQTDAAAVSGTENDKYYKGQIIVTFEANDAISGVESFLWTYTSSDETDAGIMASKSGTLQAVEDKETPGRYTAELKLPQDGNGQDLTQLKGFLEVSAVDRAGNQSDPVTEGELVIDDKLPVIEAEYLEADYSDGENGIRYYGKDATITFRITEANFWKEGVSVMCREDSVPLQPVLISDWTASSKEGEKDVYEAKYEIKAPEDHSNDGAYIFDITCKDLSGNEERFESDEIVIDTQKPEIIFQYSEEEDDKDQKVPKGVVVVKEQNFDPQGMEVTVGVTDITGKTVDIKDLQEYLRDKNNWTREGDVNQAVITSDDLPDGNYEVEIKYADLAKNPAGAKESFVVDREPPTSLKITYSDPKETWSDKLLPVITLGFYNPDVTVTFTARDITSGVDHFTWSYIGADGSTKDEYTKVDTTAVQDENDHSLYWAEVTLPWKQAEQLKGSVTVTAVDHCGNESVDSPDNEYDGIVVDTISPKMTIEYTAPSKSGVLGEGKKYYNKSVTATFTVEEDNFYEEDVRVMLAKDGEEPELIALTWETDEQAPGVHKAVYTIEATLGHQNDGDYVFSVSYHDKSGNEVEVVPSQPGGSGADPGQPDSSEPDSGQTGGDGKISYRSDTIVIDTIQPEITFQYADCNDETDPQTVTITVKEHNFSQKDITVSVDARRLTGELEVNGLQAYLNNCEWVREEGDEDTYKTIIKTATSDEFVDAIYQLTLDYEDLAGNAAKQVVTKEFTVDHTGPRVTAEDGTPLISYSTPVKDKILSVMTLGLFYNPDVTVTFTAYDETAGVACFKWSYRRQEETSAINKDYDEDTIEILDIKQDPEDATKFTASTTLPRNKTEQLRGHVSIEAVDSCGNSSGENSDRKVTDQKHVVVVDTIAPKVVGDKYTTGAGENGNVKEEKTYFREDVTVAFFLNEANFDQEDVIITISKDKGPEELVETIVWEDGGEPDTYVGQYKIEAREDHVNDGEYEFTVNYTDASGNVMKSYTSGTIVVDTIQPEIGFHYDDHSAVAGAQTATITITEHNFSQESITVGTDARTIRGETAATKDLQAYLRSCEWTSEEGDIHKATIADEFMDAVYQLALDYVDLAGNQAEQVVTDHFVVDHTKPEVSAQWVEYHSLGDTILSAITFGYYKYFNPKVTVIFTAYDETAGIARFEWKYERQEGASEVNRDFAEGFMEGTKVIQDSEDKAKFTASVTLPEREAEQMRGSFSYKAIDKCGNESEAVQDQEYVVVVDTISPEMTVEYTMPVNPNAPAEDKKYYNNAITATFTVTEANFDSEDVMVGLARDGQEAVPIIPVWTDVSTDVHVGTYTIEAPEDHANDGDYVFTVSYTDRSSNEMSSYVSGVLVMDTIAPEITFRYDDYNDSTHPQTATITVKEHNFMREELVISAKAETIAGQEAGINDLQEYLRNCEWTQDGDVYTATISGQFVDGIYAMVFDYADPAANQAREVATDKFIVDHTAPSTAEMSVAYSNPLKETVLSAITFGYYNPDVEITFTAHDATSGIDYFTWSYTRQGSASETNVDRYADTRLEAVQDAEDRTKFTAKATVPRGQAQQLRGSIAFTATDKYANTSEKVTDDGHVIVVDTISPVMTAEYTTPDNTTAEKAYYNKPITATFTVTEANFYSEDVVIELVRDQGEAVKITPVWTDISTDVHVGTYTIEAPENHANDGDYVFTVNYTDRSSNRMNTYTSGVMVVDTTLPMILVEYSEENLVNTLSDSEGNDRKYYAAAQTATITIVEHNFNPDEVEYLIEAKDVAGNSLDAASLYDVSAWTKDGDNNVAVITYTGDANYTIQFRYIDLAKHEAEEIQTEYLTVDVMAPEELAVSYSESVLETVLANISFGFYQAKTTVTLTAVDSISGVHQFKYNYLNAEGVSNINAQLEDGVIEMSEITFSDNGMTGTATFEIPRQALETNSQFNGTINFDATDRSGNESDYLRDSKRIVVDSIAPTAEVQYNEPVQTVNQVAYYDGDIAVTVMVGEANFYSEDVVVSVSKDGAEYAVTPVWTDNNTDEHTGTFTLSEDGDYFVSVDYTDKSNNVMQQYTSEQMTIDTVIASAVITINGEEADGEDAEGRKVFRKGFKDDVVLGVSFEDTNYEDYEIQLKRIRTSISDRNADTVTRVEEDVTEQFITGHLTTNAAGGQGVFDAFERVAENDGIYTMTVALTDKAGHRAETSVFFTVNRYGSVYDYSEYLESLIINGGAYVQEVTQDLVITEYNADTLVSQSLDIEISRDGRPLEDAVYRVTPEIGGAAATGNSGWYQYQYTIAQENFRSDGVYKISISSQDATGNTPENTNYEDKSILFRVDSTPPEIVSVSGLESSIIDATTAEVKYTVYDTIGLELVSVYVDGQEREHITDFGADENNYSGGIVLLESTDAQRVRLMVRDRAGNVTDTDSEDFDSAYEFHNEVTVSTNALVRWFANKQLFWGSIGGAGAVIVLGTGCIVFFGRRRKKKTA